MCFEIAICLNIRFVPSFNVALDATDDTVKPQPSDSGEYMNYVVMSRRSDGAYEMSCSVACGQNLLQCRKEGEVDNLRVIGIRSVA